MTSKSPLRGYYGGKGRMARFIKPYILQCAFKRYCEPFAGGASVFFSLSLPKSVSVWLNDKDSRLVNFFKSATENEKKFLEYVSARNLYSRKFYNDAREIWKSGADGIPAAWAVWYLICTGFAGAANGGFGISLNHNRAELIRNKVAELKRALAKLRTAAYECLDANEFIRRQDSPDTFFYVDPPYINCRQGHYQGYGESEYTDLLTTLAKCRGKFLLSSYPNDILTDATETHGWYTRNVPVICTSGIKSGGDLRRTEVITMNTTPRGLL